MNKELKDKWIEALLSGKYEQGRRGLRNHNYQYCCLGVLCDISEQGYWKDHSVHAVYYHDFCDDNGETSSGSLTDRMMRFAELLPSEISKLIELNDGKKYTFFYIAEYIKESL